MSNHAAPVQILHFSALNRSAARSPTASTPQPRQAAAAVATARRAVAEESKEFQVGWRQENRRWAAVLYSTAFASNPAVAAHLLAQTSQTAGEIISLLRTMSADAETIRLNSPAAIAERWQAAMVRVAGADPR